MKTLKLSIISGISAFALAACAGSEAPETDDVDTVETTEVADEGVADAQNIVELAQGNGNLSTLVSAVTTAGLGETLSGDGPFTVFAPTNDAFGKVDEATLAGLMEPEQKDALTGILQHHVVSGNVKAADVAKLIEEGGGTATIATMNGNLTAAMDGDNVVLTDAKGGKSIITATDIEASNGVVHTIDTVLMP